MVYVSPLYAALTAPVRPFGIAARGGSRVVSSAMPILSQLADQAMQDPAIADMISGLGGDIGSGLSSGLSTLTGGGQDDFQRNLIKNLPEMGRKLAPYAARAAPRVGGAMLSEGLAEMGGLMGAPDDYGGPERRRANMMMSLPMPSQPKPSQPEGWVAKEDPTAVVPGAPGAKQEAVDSITGAPVSNEAAKLQGVSQKPNIPGAGPATAVANVVEDIAKGPNRTGAAVFDAGQNGLAGMTDQLIGQSRRKRLGGNEPDYWNRGAFGRPFY